MNTNSKIKNHIKSILADVLALTIAGAALAGTTITANAKSAYCDNECLAEGTFTATHNQYLFTSTDKELYWFISCDELGFTPKANTLYYFVYSDNGTSHCNCNPEFHCDCYLYDDFFISCEEVIE